MKRNQRVKFSKKQWESMSVVSEPDADKGQINQDTGGRNWMCEQSLENESVWAIEVPNPDMPPEERRKAERAFDGIPEPSDRYLTRSQPLIENYPKAIFWLLVWVLVIVPIVGAFLFVVAHL